jgi:hypothetical protein
MEYRRKKERIPLIYHLAVRDRESQEVLGYLGNITTDGLLLFTKAQVEAGTDDVHACELTIPAGSNSNRRISFDARCMWCKKDLHPDLYAAGFRIEHIEPLDVAVIESAIRQFGSKS